MAKLDLLNDSLNFDESKEKKVDQPHEDLSDLSFPDESAEKPTDVTASATEDTETDSFLADLELDDSVNSDLDDLSSPGESNSGLSFGDSLLDETQEEPQQAESITRMAAEPTEETPVQTEEPVTESSEDTSPFNFGTTASEETDEEPASEYYSYEEEGFDSNTSSKKGLFIFLAIFFVAVIGAGVYFLFFRTDNAPQVAHQTENSTPKATEQTPTDALMAAKKNAVRNTWTDVKNKNAALVQGVMKLNSLTRHASITMIRYRDGQWILTALGKDRDQLAGLNRDIRSNFSMKDLKYVNINSIKSGEAVAKIADVAFVPVSLTNVSPISDVEPFLNATINDVPNYFRNIGLKSVHLAAGNRSSGTDGNTIRQFGFISATGPFSQIAAAFDNLEQQMPQIEILRLKIYTTKQRSIFSAPNHFELEFNFHQANIK